MVKIEKINRIIRSRVLFGLDVENKYRKIKDQTK
jgi:hypothetical protein